MSELNSECYAYPERKKYPIHTKQAALNSFEDFKQDIQDYSTERIDSIVSNFTKAAALHNIKYDMQEEVQPQICTYDIGDDCNVSFSKIASASDIPHAVEFLQELRQDYPLCQLRKVAIHLYKDVDQLEVEQPGIKKLASFAGLGFGDPSQMMEQFCKRGSLIRIPNDVKSLFYRTYNQLNDADGQILLKKSSQICDLMDNIDRMFKLSAYYDKDIKRPQEVCFSQDLDTLIKEAQDYLSVESTGTIMSKSALLQKKQKVKDFFDNYYQIKIESDQKMLEKVASLSQTGIRALIKELE